MNQKRRISNVNPNNQILKNIQVKLQRFKQKPIPKPIEKPTEKPRKLESKNTKIEKFVIKNPKSAYQKISKHVSNCYIPVNHKKDINPEFIKYIKQRPFESRIASKQTIETLEKFTKPRQNV